MMDVYGQDTSVVTQVKLESKLEQLRSEAAMFSPVSARFTLDFARALRCLAMRLESQVLVKEATWSR